MDISYNLKMINLCHVDATKESSEIKMTYVKLRNCLFFSVYVCVQKKKATQPAICKKSELVQLISLLFIKKGRRRRNHMMIYPNLTLNMRLEWSCTHERWN